MYVIFLNMFTNKLFKRKGDILMIRKKLLCVALAIAALSTASVWKASAASATIPVGTVVIGGKAFDLGYANDPKNIGEITTQIVSGGAVFVKGFDSVWINNITAKSVSASVIPSVTYKNPNGIENKYAAGDKLDDSLTSLEVISIE